MFKGFFGGGERGGSEAPAESHSKPSVSQETARLIGELKQLETLDQPTDMTGAELIERIRAVVQKDLEATRQSAEDSDDEHGLRKVYEGDKKAISMLENRLAVLDEVAKDRSFAAKRIRVQPTAFTNLTGPLFRSGEETIRPDYYLSRLIEETKNQEEKDEAYKKTPGYRLSQEVGKTREKLKKFFPEGKYDTEGGDEAWSQIDEIIKGRIQKKLELKGLDSVPEGETDILDNDDLMQLASYVHDYTSRKATS